MWSREVIYEEWNCLLSSAYPPYTYRHAPFKILLRQKHISLRRWRITLINGLGGTGADYGGATTASREQVEEVVLMKGEGLMPISFPARGRSRTILVVPPQARGRAFYKVIVIATGTD